MKLFLRPRLMVGQDNSYLQRQELVTRALITLRICFGLVRVTFAVSEAFDIGLHCQPVVEDPLVCSMRSKKMFRIFTCIFSSVQLVNFWEELIDAQGQLNIEFKEKQ